MTATGSLPTPIITLTTDFGQRDPWVGIMKGVILGICPAARLVDLTHDVGPYDILHGQLVLEAATRFFPPGAVHLAVVDPGVGSPRRPILVTAGGQHFVGPDNGLFTFALEGAGWSAVALEAPALRLGQVSATFHGRDVFAPAAAHLALGVAPHRFGPAVRDPVRLALPAARQEGGAVVGEVIAIDHFGNLITSVRAVDLAHVSGAGPLTVAVGEVVLGPLADSYASGGADRPTGIIGSSDRLEVFVREGSAAAALGARRGTRVRVGPRSVGLGGERGAAPPQAPPPPRGPG